MSSRLRGQDKAAGTSQIWLTTDVGRYTLSRITPCCRRRHGPPALSCFAPNYEIVKGLLALRYDIQYSPAAEEHLRQLTARQRSVVFDAVDEQLSRQPTVETRNRKPMRPNSLAPWELRIGDLRVYYDVASEPENTVSVLAVGVKDRNRILIGGKEIEP